MMIIPIFTLALATFATVNAWARPTVSVKNGTLVGVHSDYYNQDFS